MKNINWNSVLDVISNHSGEVRTIGNDFYQNVDGRFNEIVSLWNDAGYTSSNVEWINFYPGTHFDDKVVEEFAESVGLTHIRSWISCIQPGKTAPWHQDVDDEMDNYVKLGKLERYTCHINVPAHGQLMLIEQESFYMVPQGTIIRWKDYMAWHGAANCGFTNHYLFHFLGYSKNG
jgi:hypothetical protein